MAGEQKPVWEQPNWETECPKSDDKQHCNHWYDGKQCCRCGEAMNYWDALEAVNDADAKIERAGWNGKGQWVSIKRPSEGSDMTVPYLYIHTVSGDLVPWVPSQSDQFGNDWRVIE